MSFVLTGILCLFPAASAHAESPPYEDNYGGIWRTGWEDVMFSMDYEGGVRGVYGPGMNGRFAGTVRVQRLRANWAADQGETRCAEPRWGSPYWGEVVMDFADGAGQLSGVWGACGQAPDKPFTGRRLSPLDMNAEIGMPAGKTLPSAPDPSAPGLRADAAQDALPGSAPGAQPAVDPGPESPPTDFPKMPNSFQVGSAHADPASLLPPDTALDNVLLGKVWETDALLDRAPEKALPVGWTYRTAYASYLPLNESGPLLDVRVFTGQEPALKMLESSAGEGLEGVSPAPDLAPGAIRGRENGRSVLWFRTAQALVRVSAPEAGLADQLAKLVLQAR